MTKKMPDTPQDMVGSRPAKDALFDALASVARALSNGRRAEILELLTQAGRPVEDIAAAIDQSVANTSHHLQVLARAGLVNRRREGTRIVYAVANDRVAELWAALRDVGSERVAQVEPLARAYLGDRSSVETVARNELLRRMRRGDVVVLDVRPEAEFRAGHIPGARAVPPSRIPQTLKSLPAGSEVVAYCRGPYCVYADNAVRHLKRRGYNAGRLEDGFPEWRRAGLPVAAGDES